MNLLYLSCHSVLEFDEVRMLSEIPDVNVFSPGAYWEPHKGCEVRPPLDISYPQEWVDNYNTIRIPEGSLHVDHKYHLNEQSVEAFDTVMVMHHWPWLFDNMEVFKGKKVIWRDIGQTNSVDEKLVKRAQDAGVHIVRYSTTYQQRDNYAGHDAIIRFGKYKEDFHAWETNCQPRIIAVNQSFKQRDAACNYQGWLEGAAPFPRVVFGTGNELLPDWGGPCDYQQLLKEMADSRLFYYGGTDPAPYTLSLMEAMFTGVPVVGLSSPGWVEWELPRMLKGSQLASSNTGMSMLMRTLYCCDPSSLKLFSDSQRRYAHRTWDASVIIPQWETFLKKL